MHASRSSLRPWYALALLPFALAAFSGCVDDSPADDDAGQETTGGSTGSGGETAPTGGTSSGTGGAPASGGAGTGGSVGAPSNRVVGYLPTWRSFDPAGLDLDTLTHICIAFANPQGSSVDFDDKTAQVAPLVSAAHARGVKVLASIAGASGGAAVRAALNDTDGFVAQLVSLVDRYDLDGIDVDIEGEYVDGSYAPFVEKLRPALGSDKLLTAAVATWNGDDFADSALAQYDFINVMSYDHCGTWTDACEHSTESAMNDELDYWVNDRGLAKDRVVIGVPFYGYCWGNACPGDTMTHADIVSTWPSQAASDWFEGAGYQVSHNGPATIASKAALAKEYGGVMIWELGQDGTGADSLFQVIVDAQ